MHKNRDSYMSKLSTGRLLYFQFAASVHKTRRRYILLFYKAVRIFASVKFCSNYHFKSTYPKFKIVRPACKVTVFLKEIKDI